MLFVSYMQWGQSSFIIRAIEGLVENKMQLTDNKLERSDLNQKEKLKTRKGD